MAVRTKVYLDTTVPSAYFDERAPDRQQLTHEFWHKRMLDLDPIISAHVLREIENTPDGVRRKELLQLITDLPMLESEKEADRLADEYVARGIFPERYIDDAQHVAIATVNRIPYIVSWNFRHLVKVSTRREVNLVNALEGHEPIEIITPPEL